jgi:DNA-binding response OmpR family regulator
VTLASDGRAALDLLRGERQIDLVLLDIMMPFVGGLEVLAELKRLDHRRTTPVIMLTAKGQDADRTRAFDLGATDFLTKPFSPNKLLARIDELFTG